MQDTSTRICVPFFIDVRDKITKDLVKHLSVKSNAKCHVLIALLFTLACQS